MKLKDKILLIILDYSLFLGALFFALAIRFEGNIPDHYIIGHNGFFILSASAVVLAFIIFGLYDRVWRYAGMHEALLIAVAVSSGFIPPLAAVLATGGALYPRSVMFIAWLISLILFEASRFSLRFASERRRTTQYIPSRRSLIVGANDSGEMILREFSRHPHLGIQIVGFIDDDPQKSKINIHGVTVLGGHADLPDIIKDKGIQEIIIALPSPPLVREIVKVCEHTKVNFKIIPGLAEIMNGTVSINQIREVRIEDLLEREPVQLNLDKVASYLQDKTILVTGAGGSIGSEICRQVITFKPERLILLGRGENSIYEIALELQAKTRVPLTSVIADIRDAGRLEQIFARYKPQVVFHAAAHKHVPLMEHNVVEAVSNNILGTLNLLRQSQTSGVERFILLSTDKAVKPASIMGISKYIAELLLIRQNLSGTTKFMAVRFGNVLDSRGSVIPTFRRQILMGGPVTVTDPEMTRFFMTIPEAVQLVIQAAALGEGGEVFILDMGKPVKILDLAKNIIKLSGFEPEKDIPIQITGVRPGEKLTEELVNLGESAVQTEVDKIFKITPAPLDADFVNRTLNELKTLTLQGDDQILRQKLYHIVETVSGFSSPHNRGSSPEIDG